MSLDEYKSLSAKIDNLVDRLTNERDGLFIRLDRQEQRMSLVMWVGGIVGAAMLVAVVGAGFSFVGRMNALEAHGPATAQVSANR